MFHNFTDRRKAYMTLEASLIVPAAVFIVALLMLLSFYLYTVAYLNQAAYIAAFRGSLAEDGRAGKETAAKELEKLLEQAVLPIRNPQADITVSPFRVKVVLEAETGLPSFGSEPEGGGQKIRAEKEAGIRDAVGFIRGMRKLEAGT